MPIASTYHFKIGGVEVAELTNVVFTPVTAPFTQVSFQFKDKQNGSDGHTHNISLSGPDGAGNYTGSKNLSDAIVIHGHRTHCNQISFTFNPNVRPEFSGGHLIGPGIERDDIGWDADSDSPKRRHER